MEGGVRVPFYTYVLILLVLTLINALLARFGVLAGFIGIGSSQMYVAVPFMIAFALWFGGWGAIAAYLGCFIGGGLLGGMPLDVNAYWSLADLWQVLIPLAAFRLLDGDVSLRTGRDLSIFLVFAVLLNNMVGAAWGASALALGELASWSEVSELFVGWLCGNVLLTLIIAPLLLYFITPYVKRANLYVSGYWS